MDVSAVADQKEVANFDKWEWAFLFFFFNFPNFDKCCAMKGIFEFDLGPTVPLARTFFFRESQNVKPGLLVRSVIAPCRQF